MRRAPAIALGLLMALAAALALPACRRSEPHLVVYAAVDRDVAAPLIRELERRYSCRIDVLYDSEAAKTAALARRLEMEKDEPRADVWWSGEACFSARLARGGLFEPLGAEDLANAAASAVQGTDTIRVFAARYRVLLYRTDLWPRGLPPPSTSEALALPQLAGRAVIARPVSGSSATHGAWLASTPEGTKLLRSWKDNRVMVVAGNAHAAEAVARGQALLAFTDSDDALRVIEAEPRCALVIPDQGEGGRGAVVIPSSAAVVRNARGGRLAHAFVGFLASPEGEALLATGPGRHVPIGAGAGTPPPGLPPIAAVRVARIDYQALAAAWEERLATLDGLFAP